MQDSDAKNTRMVNALKALAELAGPHLERGTLPVPQDAVNRILPHLVRDVKEVESLQVEVADGYFDVLVQARKLVTFEATVRFEVAEVDLSLNRQVVVLRQVGKTRLKRRTLMGKVVRLVLESVFLHLAKADAAASAASRHPSVQVDGDLYTIDLSTLGVWEKLKQHGIGAFLQHGRIDDIKCSQGRFELVPQVDRDALQQQAQAAAVKAVGQLFGGILKRK